MCKLCNHPERYIIENKILTGQSNINQIKSEYNLGYQIIVNHMNNHIIKKKETDILATIENIIIDNINITEIIKKNLTQNITDNAGQILCVIESQRKYIDTISKLAISLDFIKKGSNDKVNKIMIEFIEGDDFNE
jgi:hypothetical protein